MSSSDRRPLANTPVSARISRSCNNRLGAVYSALYSFWSARNAATTTAGQQAVPARRDAYSLILFDHTMSTCLSNDFTSSPDQLLDAVLAYRAGGGTNFTQALRTAETVMERNFSTERWVFSFLYHWLHHTDTSYIGPPSLSSSPMESAMLAIRPCKIYVARLCVSG